MDDNDETVLTACREKNEFARTTSMEEDSEDDTSTGTESDDENAYELTTQAVSRANTVGAFSLKKHKELKVPMPTPKSVLSSAKAAVTGRKSTATAPFATPQAKKKIQVNPSTIATQNDSEVGAHHVVFTWKDASLLQHCGVVLPMYSGIVYGTESTVSNNMEVQVSYYVGVQVRMAAYYSRCKTVVFGSDRVHSRYS